MPEKQTTSCILMVRPASFGFNEQTAGSNYFQNKGAEGILQVQRQALLEFDRFAELLDSEGLEVIIVNDTPEPHTPDAVFPNNWISTHSDGSIYLFPMEARNRREERRDDMVEMLKKRFSVKEVTDLSPFEQEGKFLEGTGSMVLDHIHGIAYACISPRTHAEVLERFSTLNGYEVIPFYASDENGQPVYHTNVMMCVGDRFAIVCLEAVRDSDKHLLVNSLQNTGKEIVEISFEQMRRFCGNMLQLTSKTGEQLLVLSEQAFSALSDSQIQRLKKYCRPVFSPLGTIERYGGGSARCMIAEVFLQPPAPLQA